jgi:hypothetical protein
MDDAPYARWRSDKLRIGEVKNYKTVMGQHQSMDELWDKSRPSMPFMQRPRM